MSPVDSQKVVVMEENYPPFEEITYVRTNLPVRHTEEEEEAKHKLGLYEQLTNRIDLLI